MKKPTDKKNRPLRFTARQLTILRSWSEHPDPREIARELNISESTVQTHLKRMRLKLKVRRTFDVFKYALERKWLTPPPG